MPSQSLELEIKRIDNEIKMAKGELQYCVVLEKKIPLIQLVKKLQELRLEVRRKQILQSIAYSQPPH